MPTKPKPLDFNDVLQKGEVKVDLQVKTAEDDQEKTLRLRKDFLSFLVKDLAPYVMAILFVLVMGGYCFVVLNRSGSTPEEKQRAWSALSAILGLVVGIITGKAMK
jgi:hypothetical protein